MFKTKGAFLIDQKQLGSIFVRFDDSHFVHSHNKHINVNSV